MGLGWVSKKNEAFGGFAAQYIMHQHQDVKSYDGRSIGMSQRGEGGSGQAKKIEVGAPESVVTFL